MVTQLIAVLLALFSAYPHGLGAEVSIKSSEIPKDVIVSQPSREKRQTGACSMPQITGIMVAPGYPQPPYDGTTYNTIVFQCAPGYAQVGGSTQTVCMSAMWVWYSPGGPLQCGCPAPQLANAVISSGSQSAYSIGTVVRLNCSANYFYSGGSYNATCMADGSWNWGPGSSALICLEASCNASIAGNGSIRAPTNAVAMFCYWNCIPTLGTGSLLQFWTTNLPRCINGSNGFPIDYVGVWVGLHFSGPYCGPVLPPSIKFTGKLTVIYKTVGGGIRTTNAFTAGFDSVPAANLTLCDYSIYLKKMQGCNVVGVNAINPYVGPMVAQSYGTNTPDLIAATDLPTGTWFFISYYDIISAYDPWFGFCNAGPPAKICGAGVAFGSGGYPGNGYTILAGNFSTFSSYTAAPTTGVTCFTRPAPRSGTSSVVEKLPCVSRVVASCIVMVVKIKAVTDQLGILGMSMYVSN